ncbi:ArsR/SmtB family transcription factor [Candidatus Methanocrinis natronophilus]|uniref:Metalloregulator ArsR/SmtB family transcription factor n=1 Tax=Candidatus Methanocrinis natronophilus TaxID=3033396 RepID=A0ABT5X8R6_9EURY|nr:metalloregulator ArsR/SmtB family transcription factor [Candidatus Methanocrinis natronophilus]MDF0591071.1 metalloregulator ArsR/SmtB family transcription factor [Candidatus Methanocrinis natronophilus]
MRRRCSSLPKDAPAVELVDMTVSPEPLDPSVERLARLKGDRCKAKIAADRLKSLTDLIDEEDLAAEAQVFRAISDPFRLSVLKLLRDGELCVCEIMTALDRPQSSTSHHLSILKRAGLVKERKEGKWSRYRLADGAVIEMMKLAEILRLG